MDQLARHEVQPSFRPTRRNSLTRIGAPRRTPSDRPKEVRNRVGESGRSGQPRKSPLPVFGLLAAIAELRCAENPRVGGSIPSLATI